MPLVANESRGSWQAEVLMLQWLPPWLAGGSRGRSHCLRHRVTDRLWGLPLRLSAACFWVKYPMHCFCFCFCFSGLMLVTVMNLLHKTTSSRTWEQSFLEKYFLNTLKYLWTLSIWGNKSWPNYQSRQKNVWIFWGPYFTALMKKGLIVPLQVILD